MPKGGAREGAGRKKGTVNWKTREIANKAMQDGITPLEVMVNTMRELYQSALDQTNPEEKITRMVSASAVAKDAAPYMHAKLANVEIQPLNEQGEPSNGFTINVNLVKRES